MIFKNLSPKTYHLKPSPHNLQPSRGFTLVEMMVVISVIGMLYLIVFGSVSDSKARGRDAKRIADIGVIQLALERYYDELKKYPNALDVNGDGFFDEDISVPTKDSQGNSYGYTSTDPYQTYTLNATLEMDNSLLADDEIPNNEKQYDVAPKF